MVAKTKAELPKILTANDLLSGGTVYYTTDGKWSAHVTDALVANSPEAIKNLEKAGADAFAANVVIDVAVVDVNANGDLRQYMRTVGETLMRRYPEFERMYARVLFDEVDL